MTITNNLNKYHQLALKQGWWRDCCLVGFTLDVDKVRERIPEKLCLIHSEISEALECYRNHEGDDFREVGGKPAGFASELADAVIRIYDLAGALGVDLDYALARKHEYNKTRPYRHGGKKC